MNLAKSFTTLSLTLVLLLSGENTYAQRQQPKLGRGVVAVKNGTSALVTWRRLAQEPEDAQYNVYVNGTKLNTSPLKNTNFSTTAAKLPTGSEVTVTLVTDGNESAPSTAYKIENYDMRNLFMSINFEQGGSPLKSSDFGTNYVWPVDLDGDGEMDYIVNRKSTTNSLDSYVEGYLRTGEHLWTVKLGPNELSCAGQDDMITVADMDCDGRGDVVIQSSDGTQFWDSGNKTFGLYVNGSTKADTDGDGIVDYETQNVKNAPRYISVIDGMTGREKASVEQTYNTHYNRTNRASLMGDEYNKHVGHMGTFFFDGIHPAVVMEWHIRGTGGDHHYYNLGVAYDFSSGKAGQLKVLFNEATGAPAFHQIRIGDVDGDGRDEMMVGGYTMDHTGKVLFNTGISHGDRFRISDIDPERPGLETFAVQQYAGDMLGQVLYDAGTGEFIKEWYLSAVGDIGRGECMDIDKNHLGWEMWSTMDGNVYDAKGDLITGYSNQYPCEGIWWDSELDREVVQSSDSHYNVYIQDFFNGREVEFAKISNWRYVTVYAKRAAFWGDIIGDWREELVLLHKENGVTVGVVGVSTDYPTTENRIYCLLEDPHYRGDCTTKGYYQSPNPGFYLGYDMPRPQLPPTMVTDLVAKSDGQYTTFDRTATAAYADGKSVLIDLTYSGEKFSVNQAMSPSTLYAMTVKNQTVALEGSGSLAGTMDLWKSQQGRLIVNVPMNFTGKTYISEGILEVNNTIQGNVELRARGTLAGNATIEGDVTLEGALNYEGGRLMPGTETAPIGVITFKKGLNVNKRLYAEMDVRSSDKAADLIRVEGDLSLPSAGSLIFTITSLPEVGSYKLLEYTGSLTGSIDRVSVRGLKGLMYSIKNEDNALWLVIEEQREAATGVRWTGAESSLWNYQDNNFLLEGEETGFVAGDAIIIGDDAVKNTIQIDDLMPISKVTFENETKTITLNGNGGFSGTGDVVKNGAGRVVLNTNKSDYTGATIINSGTVTVSELADGGLPSCIGAASTATSNFQIGKATLIVNNANTATNRGIMLNDTATIQIGSGVTAFKGLVAGSKGVLHKTGSGQLNLTYDGSNSYKATILKAGTLAMGTWRTTFGTATSPIEVTGNSSITIFNNNSSSAVPTFQNKLTINSGKTLTMNTGQRCKIQGTLLGAGTLNISFPYVRGDFSMNTANFEGTINVTSGQFRIVAATDLSKATFKLGAGVYAVHTQSQSGTETNLTTKIGSLSSTASDATLSTGTWNVGYLGKSDTYAGKFTGTLNKYGEGTLTLSGSSSGALNIRAGRVNATNTSAAVTTATTTVYSSATLGGSGQTGNVSIQRGGTLTVANNATTVGTLTINGTLTVASGGILNIKVRPTSSIVRNDALKVSSRVALTSPTLQITLIGDNGLKDGDEIKIFTGDATITLSGTPTFEPERPAPGLLWDISTLANDGTLRVVADPDGITGIAGDQSSSERYYRIDGITTVRRPNKGIYIKDGKKIVVK